MAALPKPLQTNEQKNNISKNLPAVTGLMLRWGEMDMATGDKPARSYLVGATPKSWGVCTLWEQFKKDPVFFHES